MANILIVEDYIDLLDFLNIFLTLHNFETKTISTKKQINSALKDFKPDLILLDVWLGLDNGRDICKEIKESNPSIPIILMSANKKLLNNHHECNADDIIEKPFDNPMLLSKINRLLTRKEA